MVNNGRESMDRPLGGMTTDEMRELYEVISFMAPLVVVRRRSDGVIGTLMFTHMPRFYYGFVED